MAAGIDDRGRHWVGTDRALYVPLEVPIVDQPGPSSGIPAYRRLPWEQVERADWHSDTSTLAVVEVADFGQPEPRLDISLAEPGRLVELLRERVTKSVVATLFAVVRGRSGLTVVARRSPVESGPLIWSVLLAPGLDPDDPGVVAVADETLAKAKAELAGL